MVKKYLFAAYIIFIVWYTLLIREPHTYRIFRPELFWAIRAWIAGEYNGKAESILYFMNILFFIPFGLLFPLEEKKGNLGWRSVLIVAAVTSALIELSQYVFVLGECEVDDVISNTLGAMIGYWIINHRKITHPLDSTREEKGGNNTFKFEVVRMDRQRKEHEPFSIAMSVYKSDNPSFFDRALSSITELQTVMPDEIVLVVDGPVSEELNKVIAKYEKKYDVFNIIRLEKNGGLGNALKIAVENARNELIARMDSDDVSSPTRFEEQLNYLTAHPQTDIVGGDITEFIGTEENMVGKRSVPQTNDEIREYMKTRCAMNHVTVMYKKSSVQAAGGYQDWFWNEDYYLWIRMWLNNAVFANTGTVLVNVRVGEEMYQRRGGDKYFKSEKGLQDYMLQHKMIGVSTYIKNVGKRLIVQKLLPNKLRGWVFRTFARNHDLKESI